MTEKQATNQGIRNSIKQLESITEDLKRIRPDLYVGVIFAILKLSLYLARCKEKI